MERGNKIKKWKWNASEGRCRNQHESTKVLALYTLIYCTCTVHLQVHLAVDPLEYRVSATNMQPMRMNDDGMRMKLCHSCVTECGQRAISICTVAYATHCYICVCFCGVPQESVPHDGRVQESSSPFACVITLAFAICQWMMQLISVQFCTLCKEKSKLSPTQAASCDRPTFVLRFTFCKPENALEKNQKNFLISQKYIYGNILHYFSDCMTDIQIMPIILTEERMWHQTKIQIFVHFTHALFVTGYEFLFLYYETQFFVVCICLRLEYSMHILSFMDMRMLHSIISKSCMMAFFNQFHLFLLPGNKSTLSFDTFVPVLFAICCGSIINSSKSSKHATFSRQDARVPDNI